MNFQTPPSYLFVCRFAIVVAALIVYPFNVSSQMAPLGLASLKPLALAFAAALAGWASLKQKKPVQLYYSDFAIIGFFGLLILSWVGGPSHWSYGLAALAENICVLLIYFSASQLEKAEREKLIVTFLVCAVIVSVVAIAEAAGAPMPWRTPGSPMSLFGNRNSVALFGLLAFSTVALNLLFDGQSRFLPFIGLFSLVVIIARSRGVWIDLFVFVLVVVPTIAFLAGWNKYRHRLARTEAIILATLFLSILLGLYLPWKGLKWKEAAPLKSSVEHIVDVNGGTGKSRILQARIGFELIKEAPWLGWGPGGWRTLLPLYQPRVPELTIHEVWGMQTPASDFLRLLVERGCLGILFLLAGSILLATGALNAFRRTSDPTLAMAAVLLLLIGIAGLVDLPLARPQTLTLAAVFAGFLRKAGKPGFSLRSQRRGAVLLIAAIFAGVLVLNTLSRAILIWHFHPKSLEISAKLFPQPTLSSLLLYRYQGMEPDKQICRAVESVRRWAPYDFHLDSWKKACYSRGTTGPPPTRSGASGASLVSP